MKGNLMKTLLALLAAVLIAGCMDRDLVVDLSNARGPILTELRAGQSVYLAREDMLITFTRITDDSRCPTGACASGQETREHF